MTIVEFLLDEAVIAKDGQHSPNTASAAALEETYFVMPVRFSIKRVELLEQPLNHSKTFSDHSLGGSEQRNPYLSLPLIGFGTHTVEFLSDIEAGEDRKMYLAGGGYLVFKRQKDMITVGSGINGRSCSESRSELLDAFSTFLGEVKRLLLSRVRGIDTHPSWLTWFNDRRQAE